MSIRVLIENGTNLTRMGLSSSTAPMVSAASQLYSELASDYVPVYSAKGVRNNALLEELYSELILGRLKIDPAQKEFVITEYALESEENRFALIELMFETFGASKMALLSEPIAALYSSIPNIRKTKGPPKSSELTCLMVDVGHSHTTIVPIIEGHVIENGIVSSQINGQKIQNFIRSELIELTPSLTRKYTTYELNGISQKLLQNHCLMQYLDKETQRQTSTVKIDFEGKVVSKDGQFDCKQAHFERSFATL